MLKGPSQPVCALRTSIIVIIREVSQIILSKMFPVKVIPVALAADACSIKSYAEWIPKLKPTWNLLKTQDQIWIAMDPQ